MGRWSDTEAYPAASPFRDFIFGYGSIINEASLRSTLGADQQVVAAVVELSSAAGYVREWNFRAPSGFTAVGLRADRAAATDLCGVAFEVASAAALGRLDARESGYDRGRFYYWVSSRLRTRQRRTAVAARSGSMGGGRQ